MMIKELLNETYALCLVANTTVWLKSPHDVIGSLFTCPVCGVIDTADKTEQHVFSPHKTLLERLGIENRVR